MSKDDQNDRTDGRGFRRCLRKTSFECCNFEGLKKRKHYTLEECNPGNQFHFALVKKRRKEWVGITASLLACKQFKRKTKSGAPRGATDFEAFLKKRKREGPLIERVFLNAFCTHK
jgi:hypothetical protein